ncbi:hypothetical protein CRG98_007529 [Punica granatum]|uniref:PPM-type phosphatase domain-containing protein n=1 Tax=Punica granatum TaxID=22663 RepID=A0A2I0KUD2_PUNGR|nr:hypothetical protein CRG98_007529 [Punica granatum]
MLLWELVLSLTHFIHSDSEVGGNGNPDSEPIVPETVGSTAVVAVVCSSHIIVANCRDSRAVLCRGKEAIALSVDHKPNREDVYPRIEAAGGKVIQWNGHRVSGVLAMSRLKMPEDSAGLLAGSVADSEEEVSTSICCNLENEIGIEAELAPARGPFVGRKTEWVLCEEEDSLSLEGDQFLDSSVASETSSLCGEDFLGIEAANSLEVERRLYSSIEILAGAASELGCESTTMQVVVNGPVSIATGLEDGLSPSLNSNSSAVGTNYLKPWIIPDPEIRFIPRAKEDECPVLASDGLWNMMSNE